MANVIDELQGMDFGQIPTGTPQPQAAPQVDPQQAQTNVNQGQTQAPSAIDFLGVARKVTVASAMSSEGTKYVRTMKEYFKDKNTLSLPIEVKTLAYPPETLAVIAGDQAFILLFSEAITGHENLPVVAESRQATMTLQSTVGSNVKVRNVIVVTPSDYPKAETMAANLMNSFNCQLSPEVAEITLQSLSQYTIEVSTNRVTYDNFVNRFNPHGVQSPVTIGITVSASKPSRKSSNLDLFAQVENERFDIGAIGAYVTFIRNPNVGGTPKFLPEIHIAELTSALPYDGLVPLLLSVATDVLLDHGHWKNQFGEIREGGPNIGNLLMDANNSPMRITQAEQKEDIILNYCMPPALVMDIVEGRYRIPGMEMYAINGLHPMIMESYNKFFRGCKNFTSSFSTSASPVIPIHREYIGTVGVAGVQFDSRYVDYLTMMVHHSNNPATQQLLYHPIREEDHMNLVRQFCPDFEALYLNQVVAFKAEVVRAIQQGVHGNLRIIDGTQQVGTIDISPLLAASQGFANTQATAYFQQGGTPFGQIYGPQANSIQPNLYS